MSFDRTDPANLAALQSEVLNDPLGMGYQPDAGTAQLLKLLNDPAENIGGETASRVFDAAAMLDALDPTELDAQQTTVGAAEYTHALITLEAIGGREIAPWRDKWQSMFSSNSATFTALDAQNQVLSRAEVLFGQGTSISSQDWFAARDYVA